MPDAANGGSVAKAINTDSLVESILSLQFPLKRFWEQMQVALAASRPGAEMAELQQVRQRRAELQALSSDELRRLHAELTAEQSRQEAAREAAAEAARFYNQPQAQANFAFWLKADFWTFDDAIALLLGKNPKVVTWEAVDQAVNPKGFFKPAPVRSQFLTGYMTLRDFALRSDVMTAGPKLRPADVVTWAMQRVGMKLTEPLRAFAAAAQQQQQAEPSPAAAAKDKAEMLEAPAVKESSEPPVLVKAAALRALSHRWPTVESDLRHADRNGLADAAKAGRGLWRELDVLEWARRTGKLKETQGHIGLANLPRRVIKAQD